MLASASLIVIGPYKEHLEQADRVECLANGMELQMRVLQAVKSCRFAFTVAFGFALSTGIAVGQTGTSAASDRPAILALPSITHPVIAHHGMVTSQERLASEAGVEILGAGGNAVDAAVATGFALAVTLPEAGNIAGGGFMLIYDPKTLETTALDFKEKAPGAARADMFVKPDGTVDRFAIGYTRRATGVPGTVAGLLEAHGRYGKLPLSRVIAPAIRLAKNGFVVSDALSSSIAFASTSLGKDPEASRIFFHKDGKALQPGERLIQKDLANSLEQIAKGGANAFYRGEIGQEIAADMAAHGGLITMQDLAAYKAVWRKPIHGSYRGYDLEMMPPPSSGGIHIVQMLNVLQHYDMKALGQDTAASLHIMIEAMRQAYADRSSLLGDPDFVKIPTDRLMSQAHADETVAKIPQLNARKSSDVTPSGSVPHEGTETTQFSVMDQFGGAVSTTYSLNYSFGTGIVATGTGILLNDVMDDFSALPGAPNAYGLIGGEANSIQPGKRPLSSMTPTIVFRGGRPILATGSPGGSRIITTILQILVNVIDFDMNIAEATAAPRIHHQWMPDIVYAEPSFNEDTIHLLQDRGYTFNKNRVTIGDVESVMYSNGLFLGASDTRRPGGAAVGY